MTKKQEPAREEQIDLWDWINDLKDVEEETLPEISNWSYGIVQLENGDLLLAEIYWDKDDNPLMYCEANMTVDPEEGVQGIIKSLQNAVLDLTEDPHPIPVSLFYTKGE